MNKFFIIASPKFRTKFSGHHHFNEKPSFFNTYYSTNMKQNLFKARVHFSCIALLLSLTALNSNAQVTNLSDYVMFSGNGGAGTTAPGSGGYGVIFGSSSTITGGAIGSYSLVQTTGGAALSTNIYSGGKVILANGNSVSGRITAQNTASLSGNILQTGSGAVLSGVIDVNGNINIQSGTVSGPVHVTGTYTGPTPTSLPITNTPSFPTMPVFPAATVFPAAGATNITTTQTITPGNYGNVTFSNNKTLTLNGPGVYVFNSLDFSGNNSFVYNFQNLATGVFKIYVHGNAFLGKFNASLTNGGNAQRILWEIHGSGVGSSSGSDALTIANGSSGGSGSVKFQGTILAYNAGILIGSGTGSSQFTGALISRVRVMVQTGVSLTWSYFQECTAPVANAGTNVNFCGSGSAQLGAAPVAGINYSWTPSTGLSSTTVSNPTVTASSVGTTVYTVTASVPSTTCSATSQVSVTVNALPTANAGTNVTFCGPGSAQIGSAPVAGRSYSWTPSTGLSSSTVANPTVTVSSPGTTIYTVTVTNTSTSCTASATVSVTMNAIPTVNAGTNLTFCGSGSAQIGSAPVAGRSYSWTPSTGLSSTTVSNPTVTASSAGTTVYTVTVTNTSTSCSATGQVSVTVNALPTANAGTNVTFCGSGSAQIGSAPVAGRSYSWTPSTGLSSTTVSNPTVSVSSPGTTIYTVTVTNTSTSCSATSQVSVTMNNGPVASAGNDVNFCGSGSTQIGAAPVAGNTYSWSPATGLSSTTVANPTVTKSTLGTTVYTVTVTSNSSSCSATDQVSVTVNAVPNVSAGPDGAHDCVIPSVTLSGSSTTPGAQYSWTASANGNISANANTQTPTVSVFGTIFVSTADFILTVTDPASGCIARDTAKVSFDPCILPGLNPPTQGKTDEIISTPLVSLYDRYINGGNDCSNPNLDVYIINDQCQVLVEIVYTEGMFQPVMNLLTAAPFNCTEFPVNTTGNRIIYTFVSISQLQNLNLLNVTTGQNLINHVQTVFKGIPTSGVAFDSCDVAQKSDIARAGFGVDGTGIKVGVVSNSYNTILGNPAFTDIQNDDLPGTGNLNGNTTPVQVVAEYPYGVQSDEGRAMLQIVHDVAPKANLAFATGFVTAGNMAQRIKDLQAAGCNVIVDDVTHITESFFSDGMVAQAVDVVTAQGVSYWTSAGNFGNKSYEAIYTPTTAPGNIIGTAHDFGGGDRFQNISLTPGSYLLVLQWEDDAYSIAPLPQGTQNDLDIYLTYDNGITLFGFNTNNIGRDPFEMLSFNVTQPTSTNILVTRESGTGTNIRFKYVVFKANPTPAFASTSFDNMFVINEFNTGNSTIVGQANSNGAITCGAVLYRNTPALGVPVPTKASFSSVGGTRIHGEINPRNKPDLCAPNGGNTSVNLGSPPFAFDGDIFPNFFGTSASAPHGAGIAALLLDAKNRFYGTTLTPAQIRSIVTNNALDMYTPGFDFQSGYGLIDADISLRTMAAPTPVLVSLDNFPAGYNLGDTVPSFTLVVTANYITTGSKIVFRTDTLPTTWIDGNHLSATVPTFHGNPPVQVCTPAITPSGDDGGCSNVLYFFSPVQANVVITADNKNKLYGEMLPAFTATITVDGVPLASSGHTLAELGLDDLSFLSPATSTSNVGNYFIQPQADVSDAGLQELYDYTFTNGLLTIAKMPLLITPVNKTVVYGDKITGTDFDFTYNYNNSNIAPAEQAAFLTALQTEYESAITPYVAFVNDQTIVDGHPLANSDLTNLALICGGRALANGGRPLANGGRALANSTTPDTTYIIDIAYQSLVDYNEDSATATLVSGHPLANGGRGLVNGRPLANGTSFANGRPLANGHPLANSSSLDNESNNNVAVIIHETDVDPDSDAVIAQWYPINLITGTDAGCHYSVPAAFITANFEVTYGTADFCVNPYELKVHAQNATTTYGTAPAYSALISGLQYNDSTNFVLSGTLSFSPQICNVNVGTHTITASGLSLVSPSNYTLTYETGTLTVNPATLTATADNKSRPFAFPNPAFTISYSGFKCGDDASDITAPTASTVAVPSSPAGNYPITLSGGSATNYNFNLVNGTLTVQTAPSCSINSPSTPPINNSTGNTLTATGPAGYTYSWGVTGTGWSITLGQGTSSITYTAGAFGVPGVFTLTLFAPESNIVVSTCTLTVNSVGTEYCSYQQTFWANFTAQDCNGTTTTALLPTLLVPDLISGSANRQIICSVGDADCLQNKLVSGNSASSLPNGIVHCVNATGNNYLSNGKFRSYLLSQEICLALSTRISPSLGSLHITNLYISTYAATACTNGSAIAGTKLVYGIPQSVLTYMGTNNTVNNLITLANQALGNSLPNNGPSLTDIANACNAIISAFDHCRIFAGFTSTSQGARIENADAASSSTINKLFVNPNPATGNTTISFAANEGSHATLDIYGINGQLVSNVLDGAVTEDGLYSVDVDCSSFSKGIYFVRLAVDGEISVTKLVVIE
jgi:hypothetical protein